jgi:mRNA interferase RelE/StbE
MQLIYLHEFVMELKSLDKTVQKQIHKKLDELSRQDFKTLSHQPLKGSRFKGLYKYRIGDWRLIYQIRAAEVCFVTLGHKSDVYRYRKLFSPPLLWLDGRFRNRPYGQTDFRWVYRRFFTISCKISKTPANKGFIFGSEYPMKCQ